MRLIDADALEKKLQEQRELYVEMGMKGAERLLVHDFLRYVWEAPTIDNIESLLNLIQEICVDQRERHKDDSVCGLCEYDGPSWLECPGYERDDCFLLKQDIRAKYYIPTMGPVRHGRWIDTGSGTECSVCMEIQYGYDSNRNYCPECGAKMDG